MKEMFYKGFLQRIRKLLLATVLTFSLPVMADDDWMIVFQNAYGEEQQIPMTEVGSLVAVDDAYDFSILSASGDVLAEGVLKISFQQGSTTGIKPTTQSGNMISRIASDKITIIGVKGKVTIYNTAGSLQSQVTANGDETIINISHLPSGVYIVKTDLQSFKFMKR